ncbi:MAG: radical SAM protein [Anaerolineales bacterium]|nr:radical SAM protein [Anaerolineales bacterium]
MSISSAFDTLKIVFQQKSPKPGLYSYHHQDKHGKSFRIHLRSSQDGSGILFLDVTDALHLNQTALRYMYYFMEEIPLWMVLAAQWVLYPGSLRKPYQDVSSIYRLIQSLKEGDFSCLNCELGSWVERKELFTVPVFAPYKVDLALTYGCNDQCPHCYNEPSRFALPSLSAQDWFRVIDKLHSLGVPHLILTGGEPTLHPDILEIIHYANDRGMIVGMNTNGRRLASAEFVQQLAEAGLNHVQITLGSHIPEIHNAMMGSKSFEQRVQGIMNAVNSPIHTITNTTLLKGTMDFVEEFIDFLYDLGIRTFAMNGMIHSGGGFENPNTIPEQNLPQLLTRVRIHSQRKQMKFLWYTVTEYCRFSPVALDIGIKRCNAAEYSMCIEPNGDVIPCQSFYVSAGNILTDPWESIWNGDLFTSFRTRVSDPGSTNLPEKCTHCPDLDLCAGGCRISLVAQKGMRVANSGCFGCGGRIVQEGKDFKQPTVLGYVPTGKLVDASLRASGNMPYISREGTE